MSLYIVLLCGLLYSTNLDVVNTKPTKNDTEDYYWRDYQGVTPKDAFEAGLDVHGNISYIGQVLYNNLLLPGEIVASEKRIYYEWGYKQFAATENVKMFCTQHPSVFQWVITTNEYFKNLTDKHFVPGGYEPDNQIYIGRTSDGKLRLGKITVRTSDLFATLHYVKDGKGVVTDEFEILTTVD